MVSAFQGEDIQQLQSQGGRREQDILEEFRWICGQSTEKGGEGLKRRRGRTLRKQAHGWVSSQHVLHLSNQISSRWDLTITRWTIRVSRL